MLPIKLNISNDFLKDEIRSGHCVTVETKKVWAVLLDLLNEFSTICDKNNLSWFADAGTILGAARHGGFIPWDDDIDVMMPREDFNKLCLIAGASLSDPYFFQTEISDPGSLRGHAQLRNSLTTAILENEKDSNFKFNQGIFIDIFPFDGLPDDEKTRNYFLSKLYKLKKRLFRISGVTARFNAASCTGLKGFVKHLAHFFLGSSPKREMKLFQRYEALEQKYSDKKTKHVAKLFQLPLNKRRIWKKEWLSSSVPLKFEMLTIPVPKDYELVLDTFYGDWRVFKKGASTHGGVFFDPENTYKKYIS